MSQAETILKEFKQSKNILVLTENGLQFKRFTYNNNYTLLIDFLRLDQISSELLALKVTGKELSSLLASRDKLEEFADSCCQRITYLPENFRIVELDAQNRQAQIRSYPPYTTQSKRIYFEIVLNALEGSLRLSRKSWERSTNAINEISFVLPDELCIRLISDLIDPFISPN